MAPQTSEIYYKLEGFIRKYYKNQIIKGSLLTVSICLAFYLVVVTLEYYGRYSTPVRLSLLVSYLLLSVGVLGYYVVLPLFSLVKLRKRLSYDMASRFVGNFFPEIEDKLVNFLELDRSGNDGSLVLAAIEQKTSELNVFDFRRAVDYKRNQKYLRFLLPVLGVFGLMLIAAPAILNLGTKRIIHYNEVFKKVFPYEVMFDKPLEAVVGDDYLLSFHLVGKDLPQTIYIEYNDKRYKAESVGKNQYSFVFPKVIKDVDFKIVADEEPYDDFAIRAIKKPSIEGLTAVVDYPDYLHMKDEVLNNPSDITVPEGTMITWNIQALNADKIKILSNDTSAEVYVRTGGYSFSNQIFKSDIFSFLPMGTKINVPVRDSMATSVNVIADLYPSIDMSETRDSVFLSMINFDGEIKDDYGFRSLVFYYEVTRSDGVVDENHVQLPLSAGTVSQKFGYPFDTKLLNMKPGDKLSYFFEVRDNDGVHGSKASRTSIRTFAIPTADEIKEKIDNRNESIKDDLSDSKSMSDDIQNQIDELQKSLLQKKDVNWDDKKKLLDLMNKQKELDDKIDDVQEKKDINNIQENELSDDEKRLLDKQDQIDKLFEQLDDDDMKNWMDEMNKLMDKMDKSKMMDMLDKMEMSNADLEKELDRTLALFKEMQFENKLDETLDKLDEIMKEQDEFIKDAQDKGLSQDELKDKQDFIDKKMNELKEDLDQLKEMNEGLEEKQDMSGLEEKMNDAMGEMNNSKEELGNKQNNKSSKSMSNSKNKNQEVKDQLEQMQKQMGDEQQGENLEDLRQLLDNVLKLSFDQEALINSTNATNINNPQFKDVLKEQKKLIDDSKVVEDSLLALSKRVIQIESIVNKEIGMVKSSMEKSLEYLEDRNKGVSLQKQQYALTSLNNLALLLSEAIQQMQQQMMQSQQQQQGDKSCNKPGSSKPGQGSKPDMSGLLQRQMGLQKKLSDLQGKMNGQVPKSGEGQDGEFSKDLVKLANEQESIRKDLQDLANQLEGDQKRQINDIIKKMEENEADILNKRISSGTVKRNEDITIKMLDSDKALRNQDQDEKRKSNEGEDKQNDNNKLLEDYFKKKSLELEIIRSIPPVMRPYYKQKTSQYLNKF